MKKLLIVIVAISIIGCASFRDAKKYEMKKSPCACIETIG